MVREKTYREAVDRADKMLEENLDLEKRVEFLMKTIEFLEKQLETKE